MRIENEIQHFPSFSIFNFQLSIVIFIIGFTGVGKTTYGKKLAEELGVSFYDLDEEIEKVEGKTIANIFAEKGEDYFRKLETETLRNFQFPEKAIIACGGGTPCFHDNIKWLKKTGTVYYLKKSPAQIAEQLLQTDLSTRPLLRDKTKEEITQWINEMLAKREEFYLQADEIIE